MPSYDFLCLDCKHCFEVRISFVDYGKSKVACRFCGSSNIQRRIGRIRIARSDDARMEDFDNPESIDSLEQDPKAMGTMLRKMKSQVGQEVGPEFDEVVSRLESGQTPEKIEQDLPELGNTGADLGGAGPGEIDLSED
jgi:putative FmdB family regulatory protein